MANDEIKKRVSDAIEVVRPYLQNDGGDISLVSIEEEKHVKVRFEGACTGCSENQMTLKAGVETTIKKYAPQIETVENVM